MSMYGMVMADDHTPDRLMIVALMLGLRPGDDLYAFFGRHRDAWFEKQPDGPPRAAVYTRNGGGNRESLAPQIERMREHPLFLLDRDDEFDSTYATFYFQVPETCDAEELQPWGEVRDVIVKHAQEEVDTDQRWLDAINRIGGKA